MCLIRQLVLWYMGTRIANFTDHMITKEIAMKVRQNTNALLELVEDGVLDKDAVIRACLMYMSDREVGEMAEANEFFPSED